ncbi:MAG: MoaD/ThiS family protein [Candidatus Hermodarchaeota archaeon]
MSISVKLYGDLRDKISFKKNSGGIPNTLTIEISGLRSVLDILNQLNIDESEISHIFVNGIYSGAGKLVKEGDRVGIFPRRMGIMFLEITKIKTIYVKITIHEGIREFGPIEAIMDLPEGCTIKSALNKYNFSHQREKIEIVVNGTPIHDLNYLLKDWDNIAVFPL